MDEDEVYALLDRSLEPRTPSVLYDKLVALIGSGDARSLQVLDVGCGYGDHAVEIAHRFGCRVSGLDIVPRNVEQASKEIVNASLEGRVKVLQGDIQNLPYPDEAFDLVWCRDMLSLIPDLEKAFTECVRVLKPVGKMLIYNTFATDLMYPGEAERRFAAHGVVPTNLDVDYFEGALRRAGFEILERDVIGTEWREHFEETGNRLTSSHLIRIARMRRARDRLITEVGRKVFEFYLADLHWGVYQMIGKLNPTIYTLGKPKS